MIAFEEDSVVGEVASSQDRSPHTFGCVVAHRARLWSLFLAVYAVHNSLSQVEWWGRLPHTYLGATAYLKTLCALWVLVRPASAVATVALVVAWLLHLLGCYPNTNNHGFVTTVLLAAYLGAWALQRRRAGLSVGRRSELSLRVFAPVATLTLVALYCNVVWHKLNSDFFAPGTSCAWQMYLDTAGFLPGDLLPTTPALAPLLIPAVLAAEALIPLLIIVPATRFVGIVVGVVFHATLAMHPVVHIEDFSLFIYSCYMLCLPGGDVQRIGERFGPLLYGTSVAGRRWRLVAGLMPAVLAAAVLALDGGGLLEPKTVVFSVARAMYWLVFLILLWLLLASRLPSGVAGHARLAVAAGRARLRDLRPVLHPVLLAPLYVASLGILPYLGLSTENVLGMFSNIRYEMEPNHFVLQDQLKIFPYQERWLALVETNQPELQQHVGQHRPLVGWRRILAAYPEQTLQVAFSSEDGVERCARATDADHEVFAPLNLLERLLHFRELSIQSMRGPMRCRH